MWEVWCEQRFARPTFLRITAACVALIFFVAALVTMPPIAAPTLHQPVLATLHGLGRHVRVAARDTEAQRSTVFEGCLSLLLSAVQNTRTDIRKITLSFHTTKVREITYQHPSAFI